MKRSIIVLILLMVAVLVFLFNGHRKEGVPDDVAQAEKPTFRAERTQADEKRSVTRIIGGVSEQGKLIEEKPEPVAAQADEQDGFVKNVISSKWVDADVNKAGRRRVRIVEADFKYPNIRLEEEVWTDPETGKQTVNRLLASVADHVMVGLKPGSDEKAAQQILENNGYQIRAVEPGSYILAVLPDFSAAEDQQQSIAEIEALNEFIDYAEPDYLVYPCKVPNDPAFSGRKMWGLDNPGTVAGTRADADIDAPEA